MLILYSLENEKRCTVLQKLRWYIFAEDLDIFRVFKDEKLNCNNCQSVADPGR